MKSHGVRMYTKIDSRAMYINGGQILFYQTSNLFSPSNDALYMVTEVYLEDISNEFNKSPKDTLL